MALFPLSFVLVISAAPGHGSALSKLENGQRANPTVETVVRYAAAVGKRLMVSLADA